MSDAGHADCTAFAPLTLEFIMTKQTPDTDPLKREPAGETSKIPNPGPGEAGHPPASPDERGFPSTGDKHRPQPDPDSTETPKEENRPQKHDM